MIALLDANLFVPTWIIDPLLSLAEAGLCEPAWSARVMDEARLAIMEVRHVPDIRARGFLDAICRAFPMAMAEDWERFEPDVNLSDPNDGHVVAAARRAGALSIEEAADYTGIGRNHRYIQPQGFPRRRTFQVRTARSIAGCFPYLRVRCTSRRSDGRHAQTGQLQTPSAAYHERRNRAFARLAPSAVRTEIVRNGRLIPVICNTANHTVGAINAQSVNNR